MKWEQVRAPSAKKPAPEFGAGEPSPRRYVPGWVPYAAGAALILFLVVFFVAFRKPAAPELLRPNRGTPAAASPAAGREYRSENVIIRFPDRDAAASDARR